ncbi:MAG: antitoxin [Kiritimatiellae bacterium]|nr:antitoxin [Kiritimatiellia bacterium]
MAILQVRNMADDLYGALGRRAALDNRSISQEVIEIIKRYLASPQNLPSADVEALRMAGSWADSKPAEEIAATIRKERSTRRFQEGI